MCVTISRGRRRQFGLGFFSSVVVSATLAPRRCKSKFTVSRARAARIKYSIIASHFNDSPKSRACLRAVLSSPDDRQRRRRVYIILPQITLYSLVVVTRSRERARPGRMS